MLVDIYDFYFRIESFHPLMLINICILIAMLIIGFSKADFKITHFSRNFIAFFFVYSTYQAYLFGILLPQVSASNSYSSGDIILMPFMLIIILVLVPFNFLTSLVFAIWAFIINIPILLSIPNLNPIYIVFGIVAPFVILAFNKW